jgi:hypothetical protein
LLRCARNDGRSGGFFGDFWRSNCLFGRNFIDDFFFSGFFGHNNPFCGDSERAIIPCSPSIDFDDLMIAYFGGKHKGCLTFDGVCVVIKGRLFVKKRIKGAEYGHNEGGGGNCRANGRACHGRMDAFWA